MGAFLTKTEQTVINLVNNAGLPVEQKEKIVKEVSYNARLRQDGYRAPVKALFSALAVHKAKKIISSIK